MKALEEIAAWLIALLGILLAIALTIATGGFFLIVVGLWIWAKERREHNAQQNQRQNQQLRTLASIDSRVQFISEHLTDPNDAYQMYIRQKHGLAGYQN